MSLVDKSSSETAQVRKILRDSWNGGYAASTQRVGGAYKAVNNISDLLGRQNYSCGGPSQVQASKPGLKRLIGSNPNNCDGSGIPPSTTNTKWVSDTSDYIRYKKQRAVLRNINAAKN